MSFNNYYVKLVLQPSKAWMLGDTEVPLYFPPLDI